MFSIKRIIFAFALMLPIAAAAQTDIKISIENQPDSLWYLLRYRGAKTMVIDTLKCEEGTARFRSKEKLSEGIYLITNQDNYPLTEFMIAKDKRFSLKINNLDDLSSAKVRGGKETSIYFKLMAKVKRCEMNIAALESEKDRFPENVKKIDSLKKDLAEFEESLKIRKKDSFINLFINSLKTHTMEDYWNDFQLDDKRILTYPLIDNKLETYFENLPVDASIINDEIDKLIAKTGDCIDVRDYLIWFFYRKYYMPKYMNLDDVYIHLVNEYFLKLEMEHVTESVANTMAERANFLENLKIGAKIPEIGTLYSVKSPYIALVFFDKSCKKCAQEGRKLEEIRSRHPEMTIFPVEVSSGLKKDMMLIYDIQTTPTIYLLDRNMRIIAKRIKAEDVERCLNMDYGTH